MSVALERRLLTARLVRALDLGNETRHLEFATAAAFDFRPGQFISVTGQHHSRQLTRAYSLASDPRPEGFDLCLNRVEHGFFSNFLCDLDSGGEIAFHGPHGLFTLAEPVRDSIFLAAGTGIAPIRSMIRWLFADPSRHAGHQFWLLLGNRAEQAIYYHAEFRELAQRFPNFHYQVTLSRPAEDWAGLRGYVQEHLAAIARGRTGADAYICGLKDMVSANRKLLADLAWDRNSIRYERFD